MFLLLPDGQAKASIYEQHEHTEIRSPVKPRRYPHQSLNVTEATPSTDTDRHHQPAALLRRPAIIPHAHTLT